MIQEDFIQVFHQLGRIFDQLGNNKEWSGYDLGITEDEFQQFNTLILKQKQFNGFFTEEAVRNSLKNWGELLTRERLSSWTSRYQVNVSPKNVAIIMAGNIPLVGFHDFLTVLLSGNKAVVKMSSDDNTLIPMIVGLLEKFKPEIKAYIRFTLGKLDNFDAVIATGSNNSMNYFEQYFGKYPHVFRKNRTSVAVLDGTESKEELFELGKDIFTYFGLGCRNVSQLLIPQDFDLNRFFEAILPYSDIINHHKYANNYDYNKAVYLLNRESLLDNGFVLLKESKDLFPPLSVIFYFRYKNSIEVEHYLELKHKDIQAVVSKKDVYFGNAQCPQLDSYADNIDTFSWLTKI